MSERGSVTVETVIVLTVLMVTIMLVVQVSLVYFARSIAIAAAEEGVRAARADHANRGAGAAVAQAYAGRFASGFLNGISASSQVTTTTVRITVRGQSLVLVPFVPSIEINEQASGALERFTTPR